jgi:hypothetical protein
MRENREVAGIIFQNVSVGREDFLTETRTEDSPNVGQAVRYMV